jgi:hypothetical protein
MLNGGVQMSIYIQGRIGGVCACEDAFVPERLRPETIKFGDVDGCLVWVCSKCETLFFSDMCRIVSTKVFVTSTGTTVYVDYEDYLKECLREEVNKYGHSNGRLGSGILSNSET